MRYNEATILEQLKKLGIDYQYQAHEALFTAEQASRIKLDLCGEDCKNLFVKDKKNNMWLLVVPALERADLKSIARDLNAKRLSFCSPEELNEKLGVTPGSVSPLAIINDTNLDVTLVVEEKLITGERLMCHPLQNTATVSISTEDLKKFINSTKHDLNVMKFNFL